MRRMPARTEGFRNEDSFRGQRCRNSVYVFGFRV
jgi:hypothetical protein